jgi:hypothetical protein
MANSFTVGAGTRVHYAQKYLRSSRRLLGRLGSDNPNPQPPPPLLPTPSPRRPPRLLPDKAGHRRWRGWRGFSASRFPARWSGEMPSCRRPEVAGGAAHGGAAWRSGGGASGGATCGGAAERMSRARLRSQSRVAGPSWARSRLSGPGPLRASLRSAAREAARGGVSRRDGGEGGRLCWM